MRLGRWNSQQSEPRWAKLNMHANLSAINHTHCSFTTWTHVATISTLIVSLRHNAFSMCIYYVYYLE